MKFELYGLYCPDTNNIKYVGITKQGLQKRLNQHLYQPTNDLMLEWVDKLKSEKKIPIIRQIKECKNYEELLLSEINEIDRLKKLKIELLNILDGGIVNPMLGRKHSEKSKKIISDKNKGKIINNDAKKIISEKNIIRWADPNFKKKMSEKMSGTNNPFHGKTHSISSIDKLKQAVIKRGGFDGENNPNFKYEIDGDSLYDLYIKQNKNILEISKMFNCHINTIKKKLRFHNIKKPKSNVYGLTIEIVANYISDGLNYVEIGKKFGCSNKIIHKFVKKHNLYVK